MKKKNQNLEKRLKAIQKKISIKFKNPKYLVAALTHTSLFYQNQTDGTPDFERLEFFGDSILNLAICEKLFFTFPKADEGALSRFRSTLVSKKILSLIAKKIGISKFVMTGSIEPGQEYQTNSKLFSDALESLIGAIYLDQGFIKARAFVWKHWKNYFDEKKIIRLDPNPKSSLQEVTQKIFKILPLYKTSPAKTGFTATVSVQKKLSAKGKGPSKQEAETNAAHLLLEKLRSKKMYAAFFRNKKAR